MKTPHSPCEKVAKHIYEQAQYSMSAYEKALQNTESLLQIAEINYYNDFSEIQKQLLEKF